MIDHSMDGLCIAAVFEVFWFICIIYNISIEDYKDNSADLCWLVLDSLSFLLVGCWLIKEL